MTKDVLASVGVPRSPPLLLVYYFLLLFTFYLKTPKCTFLYRFVWFPGGPPGVPWVPQGSVLRRFEEVGEGSRKFEGVGEGRED